LPVRISTSKTRRWIDRWKGSFDTRNSSFLNGIWVLSLALISAKQKNRSSWITFLLPLLLVVILSLQYVAFQFGSLVLLGFLLMKLNCYRFLNVASEKI